MMMEQTNYPPGWDDSRVQRVLEHYESQSEEEALAEDEAAFEDPDVCFIAVPKSLLPAVRELLSRHQS